MKAILTIASAATLLSPVWSAEEATVAQTPVAPAAATSEQNDYVQISKNILTILQELTVTLDAVKDKAAADASAEKVNIIAEEMKELQKIADAIPAPTAEQEAELKASINEKDVKDTVHNFMVSIVQMAQADCYESDAMRSALSKILSHTERVE